MNSCASKGARRHCQSGASVDSRGSVKGSTATLILPRGGRLSRSSSVLNRTGNKLQSFQKAVISRGTLLSP